MQNGLSPDYLTSLVPATLGSTSSYPLRNASNLQTIHANSQLHHNSFLPSVVHDWNEQTRNSQSLNSFKKSVHVYISTPPRYYNTGKQLGQIYHARLRTSCSSLRQHSFSKIIIDSPQCVRGSIEDTHHYLFVCQQFANLRRELLNSVLDICHPNLNVLLHGDPSLSFDKNKIFQAVQDFIIQTKRFE